MYNKQLRLTFAGASFAIMFCSQVLWVPNDKLLLIQCRCFLLTPKLLPDLQYSEACSILNVMNGPWIEQPSKGNFSYQTKAMQFFIIADISHMILCLWISLDYWWSMEYYHRACWKHPLLNQHCLSLCSEGLEKVL